MKGTHIAATLSLAVVLAACGSGGGSPATVPAAAALGSVAYNFVPGPVGSERTYANTITDNSGNVINLSAVDTVTNVAADGGYTAHQSDPANSSITVNGTLYGTEVGDFTQNSSNQLVSYTITTPSRTYSCTESPHGGGPTFPIRVNQTFSNSYVAQCTGGAAVTYTGSGTVVGIEQVTVPAGTFLALKLQSVASWTDPDMITRTETSTLWLDVENANVVQRVFSIAYGGGRPTNGYEVNQVSVLQSTN